MPTFIVRANLTFDVELMVDAKSFAAVEKQLKAGRFDGQHFQEVNGLDLVPIAVSNVKLIEEIDE
jgi:hypothetical protein